MSNFKKYLTIALISVFSVFFIIMYYLYDAGVFDKMQLQKEKVSSFYIIYENYEGDSKGIGILMTNIENYLSSQKKFYPEKGFIQYEKLIENSQSKYMKAKVGCIVEEKMFNNIDTAKLLFKVSKIVINEAVTGYLEYKNNMSVVLGISKFYPELDDFTTKNRIKKSDVFEVFDKRRKKIEFLMPIE